MISRTELEAEIYRLRALIAEIRTALMAAGWRDDQLLRRLKDATANAAAHSLPLAQPKED